MQSSAWPSIAPRAFAAVAVGVISVFGTACGAEEPARPAPRFAMDAQRLSPDAPESTDRIDIGDATVAIERDEALKPKARELRAWILDSARAVAGFYGRFPADRVTVRLIARSGGGVRGGMTTNTEGAVITVGVGTEVAREDLTSDWVLVHEMVHLALPEVGRRHSWLSEGLATYVEGIARAQAGTRSAIDVWAELKRSMPQGLPKPGEGGLDETHTWARTYWGGALFCLLADVSIRERSGNQRSLRDALAAIFRATGGYAGPSAPRGVDIEEVLRLGDAATHTGVLVDMYDRMKEAPATPDLPMLWERLGVRGEGDDIQFDERAPLAAVRAAMTEHTRSPPAGTR